MSNNKLLSFSDNAQQLTCLLKSDFGRALFNLVINANDAMLHNGNISIQTDNNVLDDYYCQLNSGAIAGEYVLLTLTGNS